MDNIDIPDYEYLEFKSRKYKKEFTEIHQKCTTINLSQMSQISEKYKQHTAEPTTNKQENSII